MIFLLFPAAQNMCLLQAAHAVALLVLVVVPFMAHCHLLFPQALQPLAVDLDSAGRGALSRKMLLMWCSRRVADSRTGGGSCSPRSMRFKKNSA